MQSKVYNYNSVILTDLTFQREAIDAPYISKNHIWATCRFCGKPHRLRYEKYKSAKSACHKACTALEKKHTSPFKDKSVLLKCKKTLQDRYGVNNPQHSSTIQEKAKQTNISRYGSANVFASDIVKSKIKKTNLDRYGVSNPAKSELFKNKQKQSFARSITDNTNYPVHNLLQTSTFWEELSASTLYEIALKYGVNYNSLLAALNEPQYQDRYQLIYNYPKNQIQREIYEQIRLFGVDCEFNNRQVIAPYEIDIYMPHKKYAIEFNGNYWHSEAILTPEKAKNKHISKTHMCDSKGIQLFHIFESAWAYRKQQILSFLKAALQCNKNTIYARNCDINYENDVKLFLDQYHIQGRCNYIKAFNLLLNNDYVACLTLSRHHRQNTNNYDIVLSRLCYKTDYSVIGGSCRLLYYATAWAKDHGYKRIISWSDNAITTGNVYSHLGFRKEKVYTPDYFYWVKKDNTYSSKQSNKKPVGNIMTERDINLEKGLYRLWDCGKTLWVKDI